MASNHVDVDVDKSDENSTIFSVFDRFLKSSHKKEKACAVLIDFLKWNDEKVGTASAAAYSAKRLVRGLAASATDRQNVFFAALCTALSTEAVTTEHVVSALKNVIDSIGSSKSEQTSVQVTKVLTFGAIIKSGTFSQLSAGEQSSVVLNLVAACNTKNYVKIAASTFLLEFAREMTKSTFKLIVLPAIKKELGAKNVKDDLLAVCAVMYFKYPKLLQKVVDSHFGGRSKLLEDVCARCSFFASNLQEEIIRLVCVELSASGPQLIKVWKKLLDTDQKQNEKWNAYILLFSKLMMDIVPDPEMICQSLQPKLIDILLKSLQAHDKKSQSNVCYTRAKKILEKLVARVVDKGNESNLALVALKIILAHPSGLQFDRKTRTATVHTIIASLGVTDIIHLADEFVSMISSSMKKGEKFARTPKEMELILSNLLRLLNNPAIKKDNDLVVKYVKFIFNIAFMKSTTATADFRAKATDLFYKSLELHQIKIESAVMVLNDIVAYAEEKMSELTVQLKGSDSVQWKNMLAANEKLGAKSNDKKYVAVRLLLLHMGLLMFRDQALASSTIQELLQCYQRIEDGKKKKVASAAMDEQEPHWVEVTVDLLLAMLSRENKLLRHVVSCVFPSIVPHLTATALQQIVDALDPGARNDVLKHVDSDDSDDEEDADESADEAEEDEEADEDSAGSAVEGEEETVNDKLRMAVRNALGYSAALTDDESVDMDDMNEDEEERLNESLASAFRLFRPGKGSKKKQTKDDEALTHFRVRVLDLVEIVVATNPPLASCLELLNPLFTLLEFAIKDPHQKPLQNRLEAVLKKLGGVKKFGEEKHVTYKDVVSSLKDLFERETAGMVYVEMAQAVTECCGLLVRAAQLVERDSDGETMESVFEHLLNRYFTMNDRKVPFSVFQAVLRLLWDGNWALSQNIMTLLLDPDLKLFKKFKLVELLEIFYKNDRLQSTATDDCKKAACTFESKFVKKFAKALVEYDEKKSSKLLPAFHDRLLSFIQLALHSKARFRSNCKPVPAWDLVVGHLVQSIHLLPQQKARNKLSFLAQQCNIPVPDKAQLNEAKAKAKKRAASVDESSAAESEDVQAKKKRTDSASSEEAEAEEIEKKKKRKNGGDARKQRQESRDLREAASSHGLAPVSFSAVSLDALGEDQPDDQPTPNKSKKLTEAPEKKKKSKSK